MGIGGYRQLKHGNPVPCLSNHFSLFMWRLSGRYENHLGQIKIRTYFFGNYQVTIVDGVKSAAHQADAPLAWYALIALQRSCSPKGNILVLLAYVYTSPTSFVILSATPVILSATKD